MAVKISEEEEAMVPFLENSAGFSKRGTIDSSSSSISAATEVSCEGQEYKTPHMVNQHQVCFLYFDSERARLELTMVFY